MNTKAHKDYWKDLYYDRDISLCDQAARAYRGGDPRAKDGVWFKCFNQTDVDQIRGIMHREYPDVPVFFTHMFMKKDAT